MRRTAVLGAAAALLAAVALGLAAYGAGLYEVPGEDAHERAVVTIVDENGTRLATVEARVADTRSERIRGLSDAESLQNGSGMLFVHPAEGRHTYVMREMDFPLDIVFVGADRRITVIHEAPVPPPDAESLTPYSGRAKWVLEVPRGFTAAHGIEPGDRIRIEYVD